MARRYGLPYRSSNVNAANAVDAQAGYESVFSLWGAIMGGANIVFHGAGWLEGGLRASYEKLVLDADLLAMMQTFLEPLRVDNDELALDAIADVGPGGHFFGTQHTRTGIEMRSTCPSSPTGATLSRGPRLARQRRKIMPSMSWHAGLRSTPNLRSIRPYAKNSTPLSSVEFMRVAWPPTTSAQGD